MDYSRAYSSGDITPTMVAERFIAAVDESAKAPLEMGFFIDYNAEDILRQANESTVRYQKGEPISVLDGVPIAIKDEIDCLPYPTTGGTKWLHKQSPCTDDACCIKRLRLCGAIIVGKTNMHELGAGTSGINPHYGATRNPYDTNRIAGGSSSACLFDSELHDVGVASPVTYSPENEEGFNSGIAKGNPEREEWSDYVIYMKIRPVGSH